MMHPDLAMALARQHHLDLIAEADRHRLAAGLRPRRRSGRNLLGKVVTQLRVHHGATLPRWGDRVAAPPR